MNLFDAIYTRQSVERADSISVESQAEFCKREATDEKSVKIYTDKGYSGKNIDRPAFQELLRDIETGRVRRVIVYRLDRISRSVLDFASMIDVFREHNVDFVSTMEKFDTSTPVGKAMLMIVMIFAQLERETIQQRVIDAYSSRSKRGFYMGGAVPYGFRLAETVIDGVRTKMYEPVPEEAKAVREMFEMYASPQTSLGDVARHMRQEQVTKRDGSAFSRGRIRDLLINPVYVRADYRIYEFFQAQGSNIVNALEDFIGVNGAYLYAGNKENRKTVSLAGHTLVLAPHEGLVPSGTWIQCRNKCLNNSQIAKPVKARATWLAGKIKCAKCGYALSAKVCHRKTKADNRYYLCGNKYNSGCSFGSLNADAVDSIVFEEMKKKLAEFQTLSRQQEECNPRTVRLKSRLGEIDREITALLEKIPQANGAVMAYINERVAALDAEKRKLYAESVRQENAGHSVQEIRGYLNQWESISISDKITVVDCLIQSVHASEEKIEIRWKI